MCCKAVEHLANYPAATLDTRTLEILAGELRKELGEHRLVLDALRPDDPVFPEWRGYVREIEQALDTIAGGCWTITIAPADVASSSGG